MMMHGLTDPKL